ncbi:MAG: nuclear transport factor 2 family protein [Chitinophagales bacterium]|nr:nuclear transport factor 2 family protein [Hyphomicrobiales bacterium]
MWTIIAEEFNYQHTTGNTYTKPEIMDIFTSGKITVTFWGPLSIDIKDYGDTVISYGVSPAEGALGGAKYAGKLRFVDVWRRTGPGAAWRLTHRNSELLP